MNHMRFGGIERLVMELFQEQLKDLDIEPHMLVLNDQGEYADMLSSKRDRLTVLNPKGAYGFSSANFRTISKLFKEADVLHIHTFHLYIALIAHFSKIRVVYTEHGNFGVGRRLTKGDHFNHFWRKLFYQYSFHKVIANSNYTYQYLLKNWGVKKTKLTTVLNGVEKLNPKALDLEIKDDFIKENSFVIGTVSRLVEFKRIDRLLEVFHAFYKQNTQSVLVIVGEGKVRKDLEILAGNLLNRSIFFTGYSNATEKWFDRFDVSIFPSNYEPFGLVAVEGFRAYKPVLCFKDGGGLTEIIGRYNSEDIVGGKEEMIDRLNYYLRGGKVKKAKVDELLDYFSMQRMSSDYKRLYS